MKYHTIPCLKRIFSLLRSLNTAGELSAAGAKRYFWKVPPTSVAVMLPTLTLVFIFTGSSR